MIQAKKLNLMTPLLEGVLSKVTGSDNKGLSCGERLAIKSPVESAVVP